MKTKIEKLIEDVDIKLKEAETKRDTTSNETTFLRWNSKAECYREIKEKLKAVVKNG